MGSSVSTGPEPAQLPVNDAAVTAGQPKRLPLNFSPIVISGPAGVDKSTLYDMLDRAHPGLFVRPVSHTTRPLREGEKNGREYHQVSKHEFRQMIDRDEFVEYTWYDEELYGTSKNAISADAAPEGKIMVLDIDVIGVDTLRKTENLGCTPRYVFITPPNIDALEARLRSRGVNCEGSIRIRMEAARVEMTIALSVASSPFDMVIVNDDLEKALKELENYIFEGQTDVDNPAEFTQIFGRKLFF